MDRWVSQNLSRSLFSLLFEEEKCAFFYLCPLNSRDFVSSPGNQCCFSPCHWNIKPTWLTTKNSSKVFFYYIYIPLSYSARSYNKMCISYLLGDIFIFLSILVYILCMYKIFLCVKGAYLVFPSVYSVWEYHWIY